MTEKNELDEIETDFGFFIEHDFSFHEYKYFLNNIKCACNHKTKHDLVEIIYRLHESRCEIDVFLRELLRGIIHVAHNNSIDLPRLLWDAFKVDIMILGGSK